MQRTVNSSLLGKIKFIKFAYTFVHHLANKSTLLLNAEGTGVKLFHLNATLKDLCLPVLMMIEVLGIYFVKCTRYLFLHLLACSAKLTSLFFSATIVRTLGLWLVLV